MLSILVLTFTCVVLTAAERPTVEIPDGKIRGFYSKSYDGKAFASFEGIPYAKPPLRELRFEEPQPVEPWFGVWEANFTVYCIQIMHAPEPEGGHHEGDEDCLYINVYVPTKDFNTESNFDVIVHIHGGAFMFGGGSLYAKPHYIMDRNMVLVTFNYRLGPFGFLSTEDDVAPGNIGMKDQVFALKWIQQNIRYFGGNPNSVTITGLSAGGASTHYHYLSPLSKGLFHKGISVSGTTLCPWTIQENALKNAKKLATLLGCPDSSSTEIIACLKHRPARQINEAVRDYRPWLVNPFSPFAIVPEKGGKNPFLPDHPYKMIKEGKVHDIPWLTSVTSDEGLYPAADFVVKETYLPYLDKNWRELAPHILHYNDTVEESLKNKVSDDIRSYYLGKNKISRKYFNELLQLVGDRLFVVDAEKAARLQAQAMKSPVYFYYYSYHGEKPSIITLISHYEMKYGTSHGDDMMFVFPTDEPLLSLNSEDKEMKELLLDIWESFAKTGKPTIKGTKWEPVSKNKKDKIKYIHIRTPEEVEVKEDEELGHRSFWDSLPFMENEQLFKDLHEEL